MRYSLAALPAQLVEPTQTALDLLGHECAADGVALFAEQGADGLRICRKPDGIYVSYEHTNQWFRALTLLQQDTEQRPCFENLCYMADCSRNAVLNIPSAKKMIVCLALMGYNSFMLYTEDTYTIPEDPYFGYMRGRYSEEELRELDAYAGQFGIELIPCIQTLAHLATTLRWKAHAAVRDIDDILLTDEEKTYVLIEQMLQSVSRCFTSKKINLGMDEAFSLGMGKHLKRHGYETRSAIMLRHVERVAKLCEKYGFEPMMWSDMFYRLAFGGSSQFGGKADPEMLKLVPKTMTLVQWDYYTTDAAVMEQQLDEHLQFSNPIAFAGGAWKWYGYVPDSTFSYRVSRVQLPLLRKKHIKTVIVTGWGDNGAEGAQFSTLPTLSLFAEYNYGCEAQQEERFAACFGRSLADFFLLDLPDATPDQKDTTKSYNPSKYLLYSDPMMGLFDCHVLPEYGKFYADAAEKLAACRGGNFGYLFDTEAALCALLASKSTLSLRLHEAYTAGDRETLSALAAEICDVTIPKLEDFHRALAAQWERENKDFGFESLDLRLGGLRQRLLTTSEQVKRYLNGERTELPLLAEKRLPVEPVTDQATISINRWHLIATANKISEKNI